MICPYCKQEHPENAKFCPNTGKPINIQNVKHKPKNVGFLIGGIFIIALIGIGGFILARNIKGNDSDSGDNNSNTQATINVEQNTKRAEFSVATTGAQTGSTQSKTEIIPLLLDTSTPVTPQDSVNSTAIPSSITSQPLELFSTGMTISPIGNGLKRVVISFGIKNISGSWYQFYLDNNHESICLWSLGDPPILLTKEGYEYEPEMNIHLLCGRRVTPINIPPGLYLSRFPIIENGSFTFENFGFIIYEVGENLTPVSLTMSYACGNLMTMDSCEDHFSVEKLVIDLTKADPEGSTFDPDFSEPHNKPGDILNVDSVVTVEIGEPVYSENQLMIPLLITNLNPAYSIETWGNELALLSKGAMCCWGEWGSTSDFFEPNPDLIGPNQSKQVYAIFSEFNKFPKEYWGNESAVIGLSFNEEHKYTESTVIEFVIDLNN